MPLPDSPIVSTWRGGENNSYCGNCRQIHLDDDLSKKVEGMGKSSGRRICSLKYIQSPTACKLCDIFREMMRENETHIPLLMAASPKHWLTSTLSRVQESGVLLFVGYDRTGWYSDDSQVLVMVDNKSTGISGREYSIDNIDFGIIIRLLSYCQEHHKLCAIRTTIPIVDFQVIDCHSGHITSLPGNAAYIAVSYVWGATELNSDSNSDEFSWSRAPKTIKDTMILALRLGISYIWVDRYCIPQDDENRKRMLIGKMGVIYSHATLTVIAAAGDNPNYGLPGVGTTKRRHRTTIQIGSKTFAISRDAQREIAASKWNSRGWTYQEALLSRRRLVFTDSQFFFQCCAMHCPESLAFPLQSMHIATGQRFPENLSLWKAFPTRSVGNAHHSPMDRIAEFVSRDLRFDSDALNAFQGIIEDFKNSKKPVHFLSGVPLAPREYVIGSGLDNARDTSQLVFGLTWGDTNYGNFKRRFSRRIGFPSWSWLGWKVEINETRKAAWGPKMELFGLEYKWSPIGTRRYGTFQNHLEVMVELPDSTVIPWEGNRELIQSRFNNGEIPRYLHIKGWTCGLEIKRNTIQDDWKVSWPEPAAQNKHHRPLENCCDINLSYLMAGQLSATLSLLILCSTAHKPPYKVCLLLKYSDHIKAYERIGICNLSTFCYYSGLRMVIPEAEIGLSQTHFTLGALQFVKSEIRLG